MFYQRNTLETDLNWKLDFRNIQFGRSWQFELGSSLYKLSLSIPFVKLQAKHCRTLPISLLKAILTNKLFKMLVFQIPLSCPSSLYFFHIKLFSSKFLYSFHHSKADLTPYIFICIFRSQCRHSLTHHASKTPTWLFMYCLNWRNFTSLFTFLV